MLYMYIQIINTQFKHETRHVQQNLDNIQYLI